MNTPPLGQADEEEGLEVKGGQGVGASQRGGCIRHSASCNKHDKCGGKPVIKTHKSEDVLNNVVINVNRFPTIFKETCLLLDHRDWLDWYKSVHF